MDIKVDDEDDDDAMLLALEESTRAIEDCSRQLQLGSRRAHRQSVSPTRKPTVKTIHCASNLKAASVSNVAEFVEIPKQPAENLGKEQKPKNRKRLSKSLHDLLLEKLSKEAGSKNSASNLKSKKVLPAEDVYLNSNKNTFTEVFNKFAWQNIDEHENIDVDSDMDDEILLDLADKMNHELSTLECNEKIEREYLKNKRMNQLNISSLSSLSIDGRRKLEKMKKIRLLKSNLDVHKLFVGESNNEEEEVTEDRVNRLIRDLSIKKGFLESFESSVQKALEMNLNLQELLYESAIEKEKEKEVKPWTEYTTTIFGMRYFKEKDKTMSCPLNADARSLIENGLPLGPFRDNCGVWTRKETATLKASVEDILRGKLLASLSAEMDEIRKSNELENVTSVSSVNNCNPSMGESNKSLVTKSGKRKRHVKANNTENCLTKLNTVGRVKCWDSKKIGDQQRLIDRLNAKIISVKTMSLIELMSEASIDDEYDWQVISVNTFLGFRSPSECQGYFKMILDPTLNHEAWTKDEDEKLLLLADRYSCQDWDAIAIELGTKRSAHQCCSHFQTTMNRTVRAVGRWTKEEDDRLIEAVRKHRVGNNIPWTLISYSVPSRSVAQMRSRWIESLAPHRKKGRFSAEEDKLLLKAVERFGCNFRLVAATFSNRSFVQVKGRYMRKMENTKVKGRWSLEEDKTLMKLVEEIGVGKWKKISDHFLTRSRTQIRQRHSYIKSLLDQFPNITVEEIYRRQARKAAKKSNEVAPESTAVVSDSVSPRESKKKETDAADLSEGTSNNTKTRKQNSEVSVEMPLLQQTNTLDVTNNNHRAILSEDSVCTRKTRKRKSEVSVDIIMPSTEQTKISGVTNEEHKAEDASNTRITRKRKSEVNVSAIMPPLKQTKTSIAFNEDQCRYDNILRSINQKAHRKTAAGNKLTRYFQEAYPMQAIVRKRTWDDSEISAQAKLIFDLSHILRVDFSFIHDLNRHKSLRPQVLKNIVKRMMANHGDQLLRLNPVTSDHQVNEGVECAVAESYAASGISPIDYVPVPVEETMCPDPFPGDFYDDHDDHLFSSKQHDKEAEIQKQKHLQLVKEKKKQFMNFEFLVPPNVATAVGYRSLLLVERKMKEADPPAEYPPSPLPPDYSSTEFRMRDAYEDLNPSVPHHQSEVRFTKQEAIHMFRERLKAIFAGPIVMGECADRYFNVNNLPIYRQDPAKSKRRTVADRYRELENAKLASLSQKRAEDDLFKKRVETDRAPTETPYSMPSLNSGDATAGPSRLFDNCQPTASTSVIASTPSSSSTESNSSPMKKRKCPVKAKISATKTIDFCQPSTTSKSTTCQSSTARRVNHSPSTSKFSSKPSVQEQVSRKRPRSKSKTAKAKE